MCPSTRRALSRPAPWAIHAAAIRHLNAFLFEQGHRSPLWRALRAEASKIIAHATGIAGRYRSEGMLMKSGQTALGKFYIESARVMMTHGGGDKSSCPFCARRGRQSSSDKSVIQMSLERKPTLAKLEE